MEFITANWKPLAFLLLLSVVWLHGYKTGSDSVESHYAGLRETQRKNALISSQEYQNYLKSSNIDTVRKDLAYELQKINTSCLVVDDKRLSLYRSVGKRNDNP